MKNNKKFKTIFIKEITSIIIEGRIYDFILKFQLGERELKFLLLLEQRRNIPKAVL